jgi:hypothetical protein
MNRLEVKASKLPHILAVLLGLFFIPLGLWCLIAGSAKGFAPVPLGLGLMMLATYGAVVLLVRRGHAKSVKLFSDEGLARNDGLVLAWADLSRVVNQLRITSIAHNTRTLWRTEIHFNGNQSAWLIPSKVSNFREVSEFVHNLPCEHTEAIVGRT